MKISHIISGLTNGGAEAVLYRLVVSDPDNEHHVISMMDDGYYGEKFREKKIALTTLDMPAGKLTWSGCTKLYCVLKQEKPDAIQTWMYHADLVGGLTARLAGINNICWGVHHTTHNPNDILVKRLVPKACAILSYIIPRNILCCADSAVTAHQLLGYKKDKLVCVKNGYDLELFSPSQEKREKLRNSWFTSSEINDKFIIFGMVGRYNAQKDHENLLLALELLKDQSDFQWHCMLVGSQIDSSNSILLDSAISKGIERSVSFLGPTDDIPSFMNSIDVHILPSAFGEAYPNVIAEAMACATPCIATDVGDSANMIRQTGWIVNPTNPEELRAAMISASQECLMQPTAWTERCNNARAHAVSEFSLEKMKHQYLSHWDEGKLGVGR